MQDPSEDRVGVGGRFTDKAASRAESYRPDVDGLRALSVVAVFAFHLGFFSTPGGFIGVDVFFVISGYLIGGLVNGQMEQGTFSYARFYERRIRRIFPALAVVLIATTILAVLVFFPVRLADYAHSLVAAVLSYSNIYFWLSTSYFADAADSQVLLHTWSLAVEEQFYILLPPFLALVHRWMPRRIVTMVAAVALVSFAVSVWGAHAAQSATFYLPFTRAWELLLGVLIAIHPIRVLDRPVLRNAVAAIGLAMILFAILTLSEFEPFPGLNAAPVCLGTAMVIAAGARGATLAGALLSIGPARWIGKLSYSIYLWHWPVIVMWKRVELGDPLSHADEIAIVGLTLLLSYITWKFVEQPARSPKSRRPLVLGLVGGAFAALTVASITIAGLGGLPGRQAPEAVRIAQAVDYDPTQVFRSGVCFLELEQDFDDFDRETCLRTEPGKKKYLLLGDSHAAHLYHGLIHVTANGAMMQATASGCEPQAGSYSDKSWCGPLMRYMFEDYLPNNPVDLLILAADWHAASHEPLAETLAWAKTRGIPAVVIGPSVVYSAPLPVLLAEEVQRSDPSLAAEHIEPGTRRLDRALRKTVEDAGARYVSIVGAICSNGICPETTPSGDPMYFDEDHFTHEGAHFVAANLARSGAFQ
jgi:peptidoglycan/LPS O-acetylase OafA/YrhL